MVRGRKAHRLGRNKGNERPGRVLFFDTETQITHKSDKLKEHTLKLGSSCLVKYDHKNDTETRSWFDFTTIEEFWNYVDTNTSEKKRLIITSHNLDFDMQVMQGFEQLKRLKYTMQFVIMNGTTNIWRFKKGSKSILLLDNMNYFKMSLKSLGESIGVHKMEVDFDTVKEKDLLIYCRRDVEIMVAAWSEWLDFLDTNNLGVWAHSIAGQSLNSFRHRFMVEAPFIHTNQEATTLEREGYHGARTECFQIGKFKKALYYYLDVNSMYPYVMQQEKYPIELLSYANKGTVANLKRNIKKYCIVAEVSLDTDKPIYPYRYHDKLCFPVGVFRTILNTGELIHGLEHDHIVAVGRNAIYKQGDLFSSYVDFFYSQKAAFKKAKNKPYEMMSKLLLNSLYGKFGQIIEIYDRVEEHSELPDSAWSEWNHDTQIMHKYRCIAGTVEEVVGKEEGFNSFPAIAAHVTSYARILLWNLIVQAGRENVYYCDTDSLIVNSAGYGRLSDQLDNEALGKLKLVEKSNILEVRNVKDYTFSAHSKTKGISPNDCQIEPGIYGQWQFVKIAGAMRDKSVKGCTQRYIEKHISGKYTKGEVGHDGCVTPYRIEEGVL